MKKPKRPLKPFKGAIWNPLLGRWEGRPKDKFYFYSAVGKKVWFKASDLEPRPKKKKTLRDRQTQEYKSLKPKWRRLPENEHCLRCLHLGKLTQAENYPHHKKGRVGKLLCDTRYFMPVCEPCHTWIHSNKTLSYELGYLIKSGSKQTTEST